MLHDRLNHQTSHVTGAGDVMNDRRRASRIPVIKSAKISIGGDDLYSMYNCLVLDESEHGVLVDLGTAVELPPQVTLEINGASYHAKRCWSVGSKAGLEFMGGQIINA